MGSFPPLTRLKALITGGNPIRILVIKVIKAQKKALTQQLQVCQTRTREYAFGGSNPRHPD